MKGKYFTLGVMALIVTLVCLLSGCSQNWNQEGAINSTVKILNHSTLGIILTDSNGMTLYTFTDDKDGKSTCYGECTSHWRPLTVENQTTAPYGLPGNLGVTTRDDGKKQVTYNGKPLYYYFKDKKRGDANGQGVRNTWFVATP